MKWSLNQNQTSQFEDCLFKNSATGINLQAACACFEATFHDGYQKILMNYVLFIFLKLAA